MNDYVILTSDIAAPFNVPKGTRCKVLGSDSSCLTVKTPDGQRIDCNKRYFREDYKAGDRVKIITDGGDGSFLKRITKNGAISFSIGDELILVNNAINTTPVLDIETSIVFLCFGHSMGTITNSEGIKYFKICASLVELLDIQNTQHPCKCPSINFAYNGIGCKCGGI